MVAVHVGGQAADDRFAEVVRHYELWRNLANSIGIGPYEEPDWQDGRLYFRSDYREKLEEWPDWAAHGEWAAWIIEPTPQGQFCVLRSLRHERASKRSEKIEALFSHPVDAGKYIVLRMGDNLRSHLRLETLFMRWDDRGLSPLLEVASAEPDVIDFFCKKAPTLERESAERGLKRYALKADPRSYGFALPSEQTNMEVLALSFDELTATLLEGMPDSITSQISGG